VRESLEQHLEGALGATVVHKERVSGGDICDAWRVSLSDGRTVFAKEHPNAGPMFEAEAFGLQWLAEADALRIPAVLHASPRALVLEFIDRGAPGVSFDEILGRGLAQLHAHAPRVSVCRGRASSPRYPKTTPRTPIGQPSTDRGGSLPCWPCVWGEDTFLPTYTTSWVPYSGSSPIDSDPRSRPHGSTATCGPATS